MVDAPTRWPSLSSSPWMRWYPHVLFSVASCSMSAVIPALTGGRPVRVSGDSEDVHVAAPGFDDEQAVQAPECHCAVHMEEIGGQHGRGLGVQELPPCRVGVPFRRRRDVQG